MHLYRQPEIKTCCPSGLVLDTEGWLWTGGRDHLLYRHHPQTAAAESVPLPVTRGAAIVDVAAMAGHLVLAVGASADYLVYEPATRRAWTRPYPDTPADVRRLRRLPDGRLALLDRGRHRLLLVEEPQAAARVIPYPWPGLFEDACSAADGLLYLAVSAPAQLIRFDPVRHRFDTAIPPLASNAAPTAAFAHGATVYVADSAGGRLWPFDLGGARWGEPLPIPNPGAVFDRIGACAVCAGRAYFAVARAGRWLDRQLIFDPAAQRFDLLIAPEQPDGQILLGPNWSDGQRLYITGAMAPFARPGEAGEQPGDWLVLQSHAAAEEPGFERYDFTFDKKRHIDLTRRCVGLDESLYLPHRWHTPAIVNLEGAVAPYPVGVEQRLKRRAARTDARAYLRGILERIARPEMTSGALVAAVLDFIHHATYYNPIRELSDSERDPVLLLASHEIRCGGAATVVTALLDEAGVECRRVGLHHHVVAEARYDDAWHLCDALFFGAHPPQRDGRWLSVAELQAAPYFADAWPQTCFAFPEECARSADDYYLLGYNFGVWGAEPYYSYYLGAPHDCPPTLPQVLPVQRLAGGRVRLRWAEALKRNGGRVMYRLGVYSDRAQTHAVWETETEATACEWPVPETNRLYFIGVRAVDDHRQYNPDTWYPTSRGNFVLVPPEQYGWYGVF